MKGEILVSFNIKERLLVSIKSDMVLEFRKAYIKEAKEEGRGSSFIILFRKENLHKPRNNVGNDQIFAEYCSRTAINIPNVTYAVHSLSP